MQKELEKVHMSQRSKRIGERVMSLALVPLMLAVFGSMRVVSRLGYGRYIFMFAGRRMRSWRGKVRAFRGYQPQAQDVFVCTYSKSGTNWTMQIAYQIAQRGAGTYAHIHDVVPWPEAPMPRIVKLNDAATHGRAPDGTLVIKTHLESRYVPYSPHAKYLVVVRDPKDVFVSSYFFSGGMLAGAPMIPVNEWYDMFLSDAFQYGSWAEHLASFWPWRTRPNVLFLSFEAMKVDLPGTVQRIAALMNMELSADELAQVVEKSSFAYMKAIDHKFVPPLPPAVYRMAKPVMIRKGERGVSGELLTPEQQTAIDRYMQAELRRRGCLFPYHELFETENDQPALVPTPAA